MARNVLLTSEKFKEIKTYIKEFDSTNKEAADKFGFSIATVSRVNSSKNYKEYKSKVQVKKSASERELEEFLKNPEVKESLEELAAKFVGKEPKKKLTFWQKLKAHIAR